MANIPTTRQNPGDLKDPATGQIRTFASPQEGHAALLNDLTAKMSGTSSTGIGPSSSIVDFAKVYAPPSDNNDSAGYAANLANKLGVSPATPIGQLKNRIGDFADAISGNEGYQGPKGQAPASAPNTTPQPQQKNTVDTYGATFPASSGDNPLVAGAKAVGNVPSSLINLGGGLIDAITHPIDTATGLGNAVVGGVETGFNKLTGGKVPQNNQTATFDALAKSFKDRYGSLENLQRTATNDPAGFGADVLTILEGGAGALDAVTGGNKLAEAGRGAEFISNAKKAAETGEAVKAVDTGGGGLYKQALTGAGKTLASPVTGTISKVVGGATDLATGVYGKALGVDSSALKQAVGAAVDGGDSYKAFVDGLKGNTSQDDLVKLAREGLGEVTQNRSQNYQKMLASLGQDSKSYDISPIYKEADKQLSRFGIAKRADGSLDFTRSNFALDTSAQNDIQKLYDYVKSYGGKVGDRTALGVDNLKKVIGKYYTPNSDYRAFTQALKDTTKTVLDKAPGYTKAMSDYAEMSDQIDDITRGLSLGDKAMVETTFKKLTGAFKQNNEFRAQLIGELDKATGGKLLSKIAGQQLSSWTPRGLIGTLEGGAAGFSALSGGTGLLPLLGTMMATSPKLVGTLIRSLRLPASATESVLNLLNKIPKPLVGAGVVASRANALLPKK